MQTLNDGVFIYRFTSLQNVSKNRRRFLNMVAVLFKIAPFMKIQVFLLKCIMIMEPCLKQIMKHTGTDRKSVVWERAYSSIVAGAVREKHNRTRRSSSDDT